MVEKAEDMAVNVEMDIDDLTAILNDDSEVVLSKGLRRFATQIRIEHGLLAPSRSATHLGETRIGDILTPAPAEDFMDVDEIDEGRNRERDQVAASVITKHKGALLAAAAASVAPGLLGEYLRGSPKLNDLLAVWDLDVRKSSPSLSAIHTDSMAAVLECLLVVVRTHPAGTAAAAGGESIGGAAGSGDSGGGDGGVEAVGLAFCRRLIREKMEQLHSQLSPTTKPGGGAGSSSSGNRGSRASEAGPGATLRLLISVARFHRLAAKELGGVFNFAHKAFVKMVSSRRGGGATSAATPSLDQLQGTDAGADHEKSGSSGGKNKRGKKKRKDRTMTTATAAATATGGVAAAETGSGAGQDGEGGANDDDDTRHLSVAFLCSFMEAEDPALQTQMISGARGGGTLGLIFRGSLWRNSAATALLVVETLHRHLLRSRRVSRRSKAEFFTSTNIEHLRKVFDDAPQRLYEALYALMSSLLCDPATSPFLLEPAHTPVQGRSSSCGEGPATRGHAAVVITSPRPLLAGLACLGAHEDLAQRTLVLSALQTCPVLVGPYLRSFPSVVLEARPSYNLLQTYTLLSVVLREAPMPPGFGHTANATAGTGARRTGNIGVGVEMLATVMPMALSKKELTKGVLSGNSLLQAATMTLLVDILDRATRVAVATASATGDGGASAQDMISLVRQRMPEVQTLLGLRDRLGDSAVSGSVSSTGGSGSCTAGDHGASKRKSAKRKSPSMVLSGGESGAATDGDGAVEASPGGLTQEPTGNKSVFLRWRLLSLLDRYAQVIPEAVNAARFEFLKLLPSVASNSGGGERPSSSSGSGSNNDASPSTAFESLHPLQLLATLRLLARPGVISATPAGTGVGSGAGRSGWLAERTTASHGGGGGSRGGTSGGVRTRNTALELVLRTALDAPSPAIREAARSLAVRALQSLGVVTEATITAVQVPWASAARERAFTADGCGSPGGRDGGGCGGESGNEGEAGLWLDLLTLHPDAVGSLVSLVRVAYLDAQGMLATGIRAAEKGMSERPFSGGSRASGAGGGDWEVEFSPLAVAAVAVLASTARERATGKQEGDGRDEGNPGGKAEAEGGGGGGGGAEGGRLTAARDVDALTVERIQDVRLLSAAIPRLLHLHEDPRPFSGLCLSMFTAADVSAEADDSAGGCKAEDKGEEGEQSKFAGSEDRRTAAMKACQGLTLSITRSFGVEPDHISSAASTVVHAMPEVKTAASLAAEALSQLGRERNGAAVDGQQHNRRHGRKKSERQGHALLRTPPWVQLAAVLADNPGINFFHLAPVQAAVAEANAVSVEHVRDKTGDGGHGLLSDSSAADENPASGKVRGGGGAFGCHPVSLLVELPSIPLSRLLADAFAIFGRHATKLVPAPSSSSLSASVSSKKAAEVANNAVLDALTRRIAAESPWQAVASVRQVISQIGLRFHGAMAAAATGDSLSVSSSGAWFEHLEVSLSAGLHLAGRVCLDLVYSSETAVRTQSPSPDGKATQPTKDTAEGSSKKASWTDGAGVLGDERPNSTMNNTEEKNKDGDRGGAAEKQSHGVAEVGQGVPVAGVPGTSAAETIFSPHLPAVLKEHRPSRGEVLAALAAVFQNPLLLQLACPLDAGPSRGNHECDGDGHDHHHDHPELSSLLSLSEMTTERVARSLEKGASSHTAASPCTLGAVACASLSALLVAAVTAQGRVAEAEARARESRSHDGERESSVVRAAAAVFLERICRCTAEATVSGSPNLHWLSPSLITVRGLCSGDDLSRVLAALIKRLTAEPAKGKRSPGSFSTKKREDLAKKDMLARDLLERLLAPASDGSRGGGGGSDHLRGGIHDDGGEEALMQRLGPSSLAALLRLQVKSGSPGLGRLICLALTGCSPAPRDQPPAVGGTAATFGVATFGGETAVEAAASAGLLDDEAFFEFFFGRLSGGGGGGGGGKEHGDDDGDGSDARILAQLVLLCPAHANRLAQKLPDILCSLQLVTTPKSSSSGNSAASEAALGALLTLRRPIEAFLSAGMFALPTPTTVRSPSASATADVTQHASDSQDYHRSAEIDVMKSRPAHIGARITREGLADDENIDEDPDVTMEADELSLNVLENSLRESTAAVASSSSSSSSCSRLSVCYPRLRSLLPSVVVPLFNTAVGLGVEGRRRKTDGGENPPHDRKEVKPSVLMCLKSVLAVCTPAFDPPLVQVAEDALKRSMAACERSEKKTLAPGSHVHALARSALFSWLTATKVSHGGDSAICVGDVPEESVIAKEALTKEYLRHCLVRAAAVAKIVGRAARKKTPTHATTTTTTTTPFSAADASAEHVCSLLIKEVSGLLETEPASAADGNNDTIPMGSKNHSYSCRSSGRQPAGLSGRVARERLLGRCRAGQGNGSSERMQRADRANHGGSGRRRKQSKTRSEEDLLPALEGGGGAAGADGEVIGSFLTAVLKHRFVDGESLRAARVVASALYQEQAATASTLTQSSSSRDTGELKVGGQETGARRLEDENGGDRDPTAATITAVASAPPVVPEWSAAMMFERLVGHSAFLVVLSDGTSPARIELLKILVLLVSAGAMMSRSTGASQESESYSSMSPAQVVVAGTALLRPLLAVYRASLSEEDRLIVRLLRLLQASGIPLEPSVCRWGPGAAEAVAAATAAAAVPRSTPSKHRWQWIIPAFEPRRLRASIEAFPIERGLEPPPFVFEADTSGGNGSGDGGNGDIKTAARRRRRRRRRWGGAEGGDDDAKAKRGNGSSCGGPGDVDDMSCTDDEENETSRRAGGVANAGGSAGDGEHGSEQGEESGGKTSSSIGKMDDDGYDGGGVSSSRKDSSDVDSASSGTEDDESDEGSTSDGSSNGDDPDGRASRRSSGNGGNGNSTNRRESMSTDEETDGDDNDEENEDDDGDRENEMELADESATAATAAADASVAMKRSAEVYDPCFVLPLVEWGLRVAGLPAPAVCESPLLGYILVTTSSLSLSARASAYSCLLHLLESLQGEKSSTAGAAAGRGDGGGSAGGKARRAAEAGFRQRPQLALLLRCLKDGVETPLQRLPCVLAVVLARAADVLGSSPGSEVYRAVNSFLLHRPYIRVDELPLFDTLFTGVQRGGGGGPGGGLGVAGADPAAAGKARMWMLRALRDGLRTSEDLALASGKRAVPLLLAMTDSPIGDADGALQGLVLDILHRVASLRRSGARYLLNTVGIIAWVRVTLGRGRPPLSHQLSDSSLHTSSRRKATTLTAVGTMPSAAAAAGLPFPLQLQLLSLLSSLVRSGRRLATPPTVFEHECAMLAPAVVSCAWAAATSLEASAGSADEQSPAPPVGKGRAVTQLSSVGSATHGDGSFGDVVATDAEMILRSVALLEEVQAVDGSGCSNSGGDSIGSGSAGFCASTVGGMGLNLHQARALSHVATVFHSSLSVPSLSDSRIGLELKARVVVLLASPGAVQATLTSATTTAAKDDARDARTLITWALTVARDTVRVQASPEVEVSTEYDQAAVHSIAWRHHHQPAATSRRGTPTARSASYLQAPDVVLGALTLTRFLLHRAGLVGLHHDRSTVDFRMSTAEAALALAGAAAAAAAAARPLGRRLARSLSSPVLLRGASRSGDGNNDDDGDSRAALWRAATATAVVVLADFAEIEGVSAAEHGMSAVKGSGHVPVAKVDDVLLPRSAARTPRDDHDQLIAQLSRHLRESKLLRPLFSERFHSPHTDASAGSITTASDFSAVKGVGAMSAKVEATAATLDVCVRIAGSLLAVATSGRKKSVMGDARTRDEQDGSAGLTVVGDGESKSDRFENVKREDGAATSVACTAAACAQALEAVPSGLAQEPSVMEFLGGVERCLQRFIVEGSL